MKKTKFEEVKESEYVIVLDSPEIPIARSKPNRKLIVVIAGILGIFLGILFGFIKEYMSNISNEEKIKLIANRRYGIGCDQIIEMDHSSRADIFMRIFNSDGSETNSCGNAARCVASLLFASSPKKTVFIETNSRILKGASLENGNVKIDMGKPKFNWKDIPLKHNKTKIDFPEFSLKSGITVNMGNPHIVFFIEDLDKVDMNKIGPKIEHNSLFPERINVEICQILDKNKIRSNGKKFLNDYLNNHGIASESLAAQLVKL